MANDTRKMPTLRPKTKELLTKLACLLFAIIMWSYTAYVENPMATVWIDNIPVILQNDATLEARELVITDGVNQRISIKLSGLRNTLGKVDSGRLLASMDLAEITSAGEKTLDVVISGLPDGATVVEIKRPAGSIMVDKLVTVNLPVEINFIGTMPETFVEQEKTATPSVVSVKGPKSVLDGALAQTEPIDVSEVDEKNEFSAGVILTDAAREPIDTDNISITPSRVDVTLSLLSKKSVDVVSPRLVGNSGEGEVVITDIEPEKVEVIGEQTVLSRINSVTLADVDVSHVKADEEVSVRINSPHGAELAQEWVRVKLSFRALDTPDPTDAQTAEPSAEPTQTTSNAPTDVPKATATGE